MEFEEALTELKKGKLIRNKNWNGIQNEKNMFLNVQLPDRDSMNTEPYIVFNSNDKRFPWTPSTLDIWSSEWEVI